MNAYDLLYEGNGSAESSLRSALKQIEELARFDREFQDATQQLDSALALVEDVGATVRDYAEGIQASPERLAEIEDRLSALDRLKRKYGPTLAKSLRSEKRSHASWLKSKTATRSSSRLRADLDRAGAALSHGGAGAPH